MEQWQRLVIKRHLPELVDLTSCNMELLTRLFSRDILTQEEINEIDVTRNPKRKAYKLYELIVTRKNSYYLFLSTCKEIRQTGVVSILEDGKSSHKLLKEGESNVTQPSPVAEKSPSVPISDKTPLLKTSSSKAEKDKRQFDLETDNSKEHHEDLSKLDSTVTVININEQDNKGRTSLHRALANGQSLDIIKNLIDNKADYKMKDNKKEGVLHFAVQGGKKEVIRFLVSLSLDINEVDELGKTPLHKVTFTKHQNYLEMTKFLLDNGAVLKAKDKNGNTVAHLLALTKHISCSDFQFWVEGMINSGHGHIFAIRGHFGRTALQDAMQRLDLDLATIKLILESSKVDIDQQDDDGFTLLHLALNFGRSLETITNLISLGSNVKIRIKKGRGVLHLAVVGGNKEVIQYLISRGLDVNERDNDRNTPLHFVQKARPKRYVELTNLLLENGADLYSKNIDGNTLAHHVAIREDVSCDDFKIWVTTMIEIGHAHVFTIRGQFGRTPLHCSMEKQDLDLETIKLIIEPAKLDINQPDDNGSTILHLALDFGRSLDTIKSLVELGADWKRKGMNACSVLHFAVVGSNKEAFLYFKSLGADVNAKDEDGGTPLHYVDWTRSKDYLGMTKFLLENGANLDSKANFGRTLDYFMSSNDKISAEEYTVWKEGMIQLGHAAFFEKKSLLNRIFNFFC